MDPQHSVVMVVDDDPDLRDAMGAILESAGYRIISAENGSDALLALRSGGQPSAIVLDLMMPVMNGWQFLDERRHRRDVACIPVIVVSASEPEELPEVAAFLSKPFEPDRFIAVVRGFAA
jgi:CheY-like chemotaxis protein